MRRRPARRNRSRFRKSLDFGLSPDEIHAEADRLLNDGSAAYQPTQ
ncbi:hypothetical protein ACIO3O_01150 [Streptomyces sp. NPDC087440]